MIRRATLFIGFSLGACSSPRSVVEANLDAGNRGDVQRLRATFVSPELLERLVDCGDSTESDWLLPAHRRAWIDGAVQRRIEAPGYSWNHAELLRFSEEDRDEPREWEAFEVGDTVYGECVAREAFFEEKYRVVLSIEDRFGDLTQPSLPVDLWRVGQSRWLWDDPMD